MGRETDLEFTGTDSNSKYYFFLFGVAKLLSLKNTNKRAFHLLPKSLASIPKKVAFVF